MAETKKTNIIGPQKGFQTKFLACSADILIAGSGAGVGKTFALLLESIRHIKTVKDFGVTIFRRTSPQIRNEGGLWDASMKLYPYLGAKPKETTLEWKFAGITKDGERFINKVKFSHFEHEKNKLDWQGSEIPLIGFDELTHFSEEMFFYLLGRNRSTCGIKPYMRATCNPDPESWVAEFISWWIDQNTGFPIPERAGKIRYFVKNGSEYIWGNSKKEVAKDAAFILDRYLKDDKSENPDINNYIKSLAFIPGNIQENQKLLSKDPGYIANLLSQGADEKLRLLDGNWKHSDSSLDLFPISVFGGMFDNNIDVKTGVKSISADIAMEGSDKFIVGVFDGKELIDLLIMDKSNGKQVLTGITDFQAAYKVINARTIYDNDGVGAFLGGFIPQGVPFHNGAKAIGRDNYKNIKTQCYYKAAASMLNGGYRISESVANMRYDERHTVRQRFEYERKAIKKGEDMESKLIINPKKEQRVILNGGSPDLIDMLIMMEYFDIGQKF